MSIEQYTEHLLLKEMDCEIGENDFGFVFPQGDTKEIEKIDSILKEMGGKPKECDLENFEIKGSGKAKPEFIITFKEDLNTIIVVECKNTIKKHSTDKKNKPSL